MAQTKQKYDTSFINQEKKQLGYSDTSLNLTVRNNAMTFGKYLLFGYLAAFSTRVYNLSFEDDGLLFIQRSFWTNALLPDKTNFIANDEIKELTVNPGALMAKITIINQSGKKLIFKANKKIAGLPWQKESLAKVVEQYGKK